MQSRRMKTDEAREALAEAMRRVSTIALVHESLLQGSQEAVHFDEVIDRCLRLAVDAASATVHRAGTPQLADAQVEVRTDRKSTRLNSSHVSISYAVFCLKKKN